MSKPVLKVKNLNVKLGNKEIISDLSFEVNRSDVLIILGPNGAGKTTLLKSLLGLIPSEGEIIWASKKISYLPPQELIQRKNLFPMTIKEFFEFKNIEQEDILKIFQEVGLDLSLLERPFGTLSTGQFQRMIIAWALVDNPDILLFDEATYGVDAGGEETIYSLLHRIWQQRHLTILLVTHDLNIVYEHANNVLCLNKEKLCYGKPLKVLTPKNLQKIYGTGIKFYKHTH
ncbi:MAG: metal ABC transporter ATP-binding protein [Patescibacteria group bacterium]|nr:metal ABC transporter ATP-binding protein [Patescibacteria group bacterium]